MTAASPAPEVPDWIYSGADVILLVDKHDRWDDPTFYRALVGKIAKQSFTVVFNKHDQNLTERIKIKDLRSKDYGSSWNHWRYRVLAKDSIEVRRLRELRARKTSRDKATTAARKFTEGNADRDNLDLIRDAIVALTKHADLVLKQDTAHPVHRVGALDPMTRCGKPVSEHRLYVSFVAQSVTCPDCKENRS